MELYIAAARDLPLQFTGPIAVRMREGGEKKVAWISGAVNFGQSTKKRKQKKTKETLHNPGGEEFFFFKTIIYPLVIYLFHVPFLVSIKLNFRCTACAGL